MQIFQEMAVQGQSFFSASGDYDAYTGLIPFPGDTPYITQVGGTTLTTTGPGGAWVSETVWNWGDGIGSGGGISTQYPIPCWQTNIDMTANQGSTTMRNTPDVALTADNVYVRVDGGEQDVGGTSCAAPLWAGFTALVNEQAAASGQEPVGFVNPLVDAIGSGPNYTSAFHDITTGNNTTPASPTKFYAVAGYDLCTGWGTPNGQKLIDALANPEPLVITPTTGFTSLGGVGGPFTVSSQNFSLTNVGTNSLTWTLINTSLWLNVSAPGGTLAAGGPATNVTVSLNTVASNLVVGTYNTTVWFTNLNDNVGQSRQFNLAVLSPPTITVQPTNQAVLDGATAPFTVEVTGGLPLYYQWQYNSNNLTDGGTIAGSTTTNLTIYNASLANEGYYSVIVSNVAGVAISSNALLSIVPSPPVITTQPTNEAVGVRGTAQFSVAAIGTKPFAYQWSFNGTNLDGATNATLLLNNVQFDQTGIYAVVITNVYGSVQSSNADLTVLPCDPAPLGLVSWWPGEGNADDLVGTNNGILQGGMSFGPGEVGQGFVFNGTNAYVRIPASGSLNVGAGGGFTIEGWINPVSTALEEPVAEWNNGSSWGAHFWISVPSPDGTGAGCLYANILDSSGIAHSFSSVAGLVTSNEFQHVALTYDKSSGLAILYLNGVVVAQQNLGSLTPQTTYDLYLGYRPRDPVSYWAGSMDEVSLYNRALSSNEIAAIYVAGSGGKCFTPTAPVITTQPTNQTVVVGQTAQFSVTATGTPPLSYQWTLNTTNLANATNATLVLTNVQFSQAGNYAVVVSNLADAVLSSNAVLTVNPVPSCDPAPSGLVSWWPGEGNADDLIGTNNGVLEGGVSFASGEVGQAFSLDGTSGYVLVPGSASLNVGLTNGFTIEGWINPADDSVQRPIAEWNNGNTWGAHFWISVGNGGGLSIGSLYANILDTGGGNHYLWSSPGLVVTNQFQHVALTYDKSSGVGTLYVNGTAVATANLGVFTPQTSYNFYLGHRPGASFWPGLLDEISVYNRALSANEIQAIYLVGSGGKCFTPTAPVITSQPTNQTVVVGQTAQFSVTATGTPPLSYQWTWNTTNLANATNATLVLTNVQFSQAGNYAVVVSNLADAVLSSNAVLTVNPVPSCDPAPSGLVSWWPGEGNADDLVGTNNGILQGGMSFGPGEVGQGFVFNGTNAYVRIPASGSLNVGAGDGFTIEGWINPGDVSVQRPIAEWNNGVGYGAQLWVATPVPYGAGPGCLYANLADNVGNHSFSSAAGLVTSNEFQHVALTYDKSSGLAVLYLDGVVVAQQNLGSLTPQTTYDLYLGYRPSEGSPPDQAHYWAGSMDEVTLYNRALSSNEIAAIYLAGSGGKCFTPMAPVITTQPTNQTVVVGQTAQFSVTATGTPPLSYQWTWNTTNLANATNATLVLTNVQFSQAGNYAVVVSNLADAVLSSNAVLTVNPVPSCDPAPSGLVSWWPGEGNADDLVGTNNGILQGGMSFGPGEVGQGFVFNGTNAYVRIPASGSLNVGAGGGFTIEGWINPVSTALEEPVVEWNNGSSWATHFWISVPSPDGTGAGCLYANILDSSGIAHSFSSAAGLVTSNEFQHVALTYDKSSGLAILYLNGVVIAQKNLGSFTPLTTYDLYLGYRPRDPVSYWAGSMDEVSLYNRALSSNEIAAIYVAGSGGKCFTPTAPVITTQPTNQTVVVGQTAQFSVTATGTPPLSYQWTWNTTNLANATNATLVLTNVQFSQAGNYAVVVSNLADAVLSSNAILTVLTPPTITAQPTNQTVYVGNTASFSVAASGTPPLNYQWNFNTTNLMGATNATLTLTNVQPNQAGDYAVLVANSIDSVLSSNAVLTVNPLPALGVVPSGNSLLIFWPTSTPGFVLEVSPSLAPADWIPVPDSPVQLGGIYLESIQMTNSISFYRLYLSGQ